MATRIRKTHPLVATLAATINSFKAILGTLTDPTHHHTSGAITVATLRRTETVVPVAAATQIHASMAAGGALNVSSAFTRINPPSNLRVSRGGAGAATIYTATGTRFGSVITETINSNGASDVEGVKIFDTVTSLTSNVDPTVTTTLKSGNMIALGSPVATLLDLAVAAAPGTNGVVETGTLNAALDGYVPTTAPDGTKQFQARVTYVPTATAAATADVATGITVAVGGTSNIHFDASEVTVGFDALSGTDPADETAAIVAANELKAVYEFHLADTLAHKIADPAPTLTLATTLATAYTLVNAIYTDYNLHRASTTYHQNADSTNVASSTSASTLSTLQDRANDLKTQLNLHMADAVAGASLRVVDA